MPYIPTTQAEREAMLRTIGVGSVDDLFSDIPEALRFRGELHLPAGKSEPEVAAYMGELAGQNVDLDRYACFLGAGAYDHLVPAALHSVISRNEFVTAYTPYQAEMSQGVLQTVYEYQSLICLLTGLDVANASMYDGGSAVAEAGIMAVAAKDRPNVVMAGTVHPEYRRVTQTYLSHQGVEVRIAPQKGAYADMEALADLIDGQTAGVFAQQPNTFGAIEDMAHISRLAKAHDALFIAVVDPISLGILKAPASYGADIAVGEGQSLGNPISFGGPYLGFLAAKDELIRRVPGRIVGRTVDNQGRPGFVLTLQTREQHIKRERATSNICTNQALNALTAAVYLSLVGKEGLRRIAELCVQKANYAYQRLQALPGWEAPWRAPFFKEFVLQGPVSVEELNRGLLKHRIVGGFPVERWAPSLTHGVLFCVTEARTRAEIDRLVDAVAELSAAKGGTRP